MKCQTIHFFSFIFFASLLVNKHNFFSFKVQFLVFVFSTMAEAISSEDSNSPEAQADRKAAIQKFADAFETKMFSDVTLVVKGVEFSAHKQVLSIQNKYFQNLFNDWKEAEANKVTIALDVEPDVFKIILEFIYKAQLSHREKKLDAHAVDLIKAADMVCSKTCPETIGNFI